MIKGASDLFRYSAVVNDPPGTAISESASAYTDSRGLEMAPEFLYYGMQLVLEIRRHLIFPYLQGEVG